MLKCVGRKNEGTHGMANNVRMVKIHKPTSMSDCQSSLEAQRPPQHHHLLRQRSWHTVEPIPSFFIMFSGIAVGKKNVSWVGVRAREVEFGRLVNFHFQNLTN